MTKAERIEDLGRLREKLDRICNSEIFISFNNIRPKDSYEWFQQLSEEKQHDLILQLAYSLRNLNDDLCECFFIAKGDEEDN